MGNKRIFFIFLLAFFSVTGVVYPEDAGAQLPNVCVSGIMYDAQSSLAVVNGEPVKPGEEINGIKVVKISESAVSFEYKGQSFEKRIGDNCITSPFLYKQTSQITKIINRPHSSQVSARARRANSRISIFHYENLFMFVLLIVAILFYVYNSLCLQKIAAKTNTPFGWFAWLPILNVFLILMIANKSFWWLILLLIPLVNLACIIIIWMEIAKRRNKPAWLGLLMMLPVANFLVIGYLAFSG
ncbi:MAG: DUF5684 domain-containing protein [Candidatus Omnitrophica bacterium]|nr:DUF5684 domain-containing protein [Candidatus Omnitrophota bacterium]